MLSITLLMTIREKVVKKKRLRAQEEYLDRLKTKTPGITLIKESTDETNHDKKKRLREEAQELYYKQ
jgi:hypothetical protein